MSVTAPLKRLPHELSTHAVARFRSRCAPHMSEPEARGYLLAQLERAHFVKTLSGGVEQWRGPKPLRLRIRVLDGVVVTIIPCCDSWTEPTR